MSDEENKPLFLQDLPEAKPAEESAELAPVISVTLSPRQKKAAEMFSKGIDLVTIATKLDYTETYVTALIAHPKVRTLIQSHIEKPFEDTLDDRMKSLGKHALDAIEEQLTDSGPAHKKENLSRWLIEKLTGKASQQIDIKGEITVGVFMDELARAKASGQIIDITSTPLKELPESSSQQDSSEIVIEANPMDAWADENL